MEKKRLDSSTVGQGAKVGYRGHGHPVIRPLWDGILSFCPSWPYRECKVCLRSWFVCTFCTNVQSSRKVVTNCTRTTHLCIPRKLYELFSRRKRWKWYLTQPIASVLPPTTFFCTRRWKKVWKNGFCHQLKGSKQLYRANFNVCQRMGLKRSSRSGGNIGKSVLVSEVVMGEVSILIDTGKYR